MDKRYTAIRERFETLETEEIKNILDNIDLVCFDTFNYDEANKTYCPIAIAMNLHNTVKKPTDNAIWIEISKRFFPVNILKGTSGDFYRENRKEDLVNICQSIIKQRTNVNDLHFSNKL